MENTIDFSTMPRKYVVCWHSNCPLADNCLRHLATEYLDEKKKVVESVNLRTVSPETGTCTQQRPVQKVRYAYGMRRIYDNVLAKDKDRLYFKIWLALGNSMYYRYRNGERPITPRVQEVIASAFRKFGYTEPVAYDRYTEAIEW